MEEDLLLVQTSELYVLLYMLDFSMKLIVLEKKLFPMNRVMFFLLYQYKVNYINCSKSYNITPSKEDLLL